MTLFPFLIIFVLLFYFFMKLRIVNQRNKEELEKKRAEELAIKQENENRKIQELKIWWRNFIEKYFAAIKDASTEFKTLLDYKHGYFTYTQLQNFINKYQYLYNEINSSNWKNNGLYPEQVELIDYFKNIFKKGNAIRETRNNNFINAERELFKSLFNEIEGKILDNQQIEAIIKDEDNNLVIAGAGSGKTTTIIGKLAYINKRYHPDPDSVLLISFTRKSAADLSVRLGNSNIKASTFHRLGLDVITEVENARPSIYDDAAFNYFLTKTFNSLCHDPAYLSKVVKYFSELIKQTKPLFSFETRGDYFQHLKNVDIKTFKGLSDYKNNRVSYKMEVVKSIEECLIANFLFFNNINYEYESSYEFKTSDKNYRQYKPDFTIIHNDKKIYLEHFAISRDGNVPPFFAINGESYEEAKKLYLDGIEWKRKLHEKHGTILIETYSYENSEGILLETLSQKLESVGVVFHPMSKEQIWSIIKNVSKTEVDSFTNLIQTFIVLLKSNNYSLNEIEKTISKEGTERDRVFLALVIPIYDAYQKMLMDKNEIDFSDMINRAASYILSGAYNRSFTYVIVDEFQDLSIGRYALLKAIKTRNPGCKFYCVGDDWQSIYRFAGSDISLFTEFEKYFGYTAKSYIETTYRFADPILTLSGEFIQKNPCQQKKQLKHLNDKNNTHYSFLSSRETDNDLGATLRSVFDEIVSKWPNYEEKKILLLGRYSIRLSNLEDSSDLYTVNRDQEVLKFIVHNPNNSKVSEISIPYYTVHRSKGLEADIVIIINCNSGRLGFPSQMSDDPVLRFVLSSEDNFQNGEERRLFYVAMTRAKDHVYFIYDPIMKSSFIQELLSETDNEIKRCPLCINADLIYREGSSNGNKWAFWGCSNFKLGCDYKEWIDLDE